MKLVFNVDLDNTLIYSYKHNIGSCKRCAEIYQEREISFITEKTQELLNELVSRILIVPTTTRTIEQYKRIELGLGRIPYALVCNGGILLVDDVVDEEWYAESLKMIADSTPVLDKAQIMMEEDVDRCFEVRNISGLFLFTKSNQPEASVKRLSGSLDTSLVDIFHNGNKVYVVPAKLNKGNAIKRLKEKLKAEKVIAAGDSEFDVSMLQCADIGIAPMNLDVGESNIGNIVKIESDVLFSEGHLSYIAKILPDIMLQE